MNEGWSIWYAVRHLLSTQWKVLLIVMAVSGVFGSLYGLRQDTTYVARAEIVTGTYSLPINIGTASVVDKAGPLALELPAETQARIISSPAIVGVAADILGLNEDERILLNSGVKATPTTDNSFAIAAPGDSAQKAADSANAIAKAYLTYRTDVGRGELNQLSTQAKGQSASNSAAAKAMDEAIKSSLSNPSYASTLLTRQQELERSAAAAAASADQLNAMSLSFTGGGSILQPATATMAAKSVGVAMYVAISVIAGLGLGILVVAARRQFSDRILDRQDIIRATGVHAVFSSRGHEITRDDCALLLRIMDNDCIEFGRNSNMVALRSMSLGDASYCRIALQLAAAAQAQDRRVAVVMTKIIAGEHGLAASLRQTVGAEWDELAADDHAEFEKTTGLTATGILVSPRSSRSLDLILAVTGSSNGDSGGIGGLPSSFDGPIVLVVEERKDRSSVLHENVEQLKAAGMRVAAIVLVSNKRQRVQSSQHVARGRTDVDRETAMDKTRNLSVEPVTRPDRDGARSSDSGSEVRQDYESQKMAADGALT